jgi:branched-chain amino acid transport system substrate-binding protein
MKKNVLVSVLMLVAFVVGFASIGSAASPIRIGAPVLLSGAGTYVGGAQKDTLEMMAAELNKAGGIKGRPLEFIFYDEEGKPDVAVTVVKRLIQKDKVTAILGISTSWSAAAVIPIIEQSQIPAIVLGAATSITDPVKKWVFKTPADDRLTVASILNDMRVKGIKRIAIVSSQDAFGDSGHGEVVAQAPGNDIKVVFDERYTMEDTDITPLLNKIKSTDAQAVVNWSSRRALVVMTNNYRQVGITLPLYHSNAAMSKDFLDATGKNADGVLLAGPKIFGAADLAETDPQKKVIQGYMQKYKEKYGKEAGMFGAVSFDAFNMLVAALKKAPDDKAKLRNAIEQTKNYVGVMGQYNYSPKDHAGLTRDSLIMYQAVGGAWKPVK